MGWGKGERSRTGAAGEHGRRGMWRMTRDVNDEREWPKVFAAHGSGRWQGQGLICSRRDFSASASSGLAFHKRYYYLKCVASFILGVSLL